MIDPVSVNANAMLVLVGRDVAREPYARRTVRQEPQPPTPPRTAA